MEEKAALLALEERQARILNNIASLAARAGCQELASDLKQLDVPQTELVQHMRSLWVPTDVPTDHVEWEKHGQILEDKLASVQEFAECDSSTKGKLKDHEGPAPETVEQRLSRILRAQGTTEFRFARVPEDYYSRSFQERRDLLGAASIFHLCKTIVMVNTQAHSSIKDCSDPKNSKYYLLVVQYCARLNADKVRQFFYSLNNGLVPKGRFNFRLAQELESELLTGYGHNAVTPIGMRTKIPVRCSWLHRNFLPFNILLYSLHNRKEWQVILSDVIPKLKPDFFWLGGGEVDIKLGLRTDDFIKLVNPFIIECT